ncbi:MAG: hypothetical protein M1825_004669 [Sarcosagium campestre]|nr:MAG: hypothetical protein M1825_004669 [Sarcosagium campestre]
MLLYHRPVPAKIPKRRSRAGCIHCKEKKKKCNEERPQCDRCMERGLKCQYEPVKPRKRRRTTSAIEQEEQRARSVTSDPGPQTGYQSGFRAAVPGAVRNVLHDFRQNSSGSSNLDSVWDDDGHSGFASPVSSVADLMLDGVDGLPPLHELDERMGPNGGMPVSCTAADFTLPSTAASPTIAGNFTRSPTSSEMMNLHGGHSYPELSIATPTSNHSSVEFVKSPYGVSPRPPIVEFSPRPNRRVLIDHFTNVVCHLLVFKEDNGNPFQQYILPMATRSPPVMNAIYGLSAAHMEHRGLENEEKSLDFHSRTLQGLAHLINDQRTSRDEVLAVIMLLVYFEIVRGGSQVVLQSHMRGALSIMKARRIAHAPTAAFLEKSFRYFDVICALSFGSSPMAGSAMPPTNSDMMHLQELTAMTPVDTIFGLFGSLWPIVHRLSTMLDLKREIEKQEHQDAKKAASMRNDFENTCATIELALHQWTPKVPAPGVATENLGDDSRLQSILSNAEAYKQAALVYLFRTVLGHPRTSTKVQTHAKQALQACLRVIIFAGPMSAITWPLFNAACEAVEEVDRNVARTVFRHLENRQGMQNIMQSWEAMEETWRRQDDGDESEWRKVVQDMERAVVLG